MEAFTSVLIDIDSAAPAHPALDRAVRLARGCGAQLTICDVLTIPGNARRYLQTEVEEDLVKRRRQQLEDVAQHIHGVKAESILLVGRPATALIREVLRSGHDLLVRSHGRDLGATGDKPYGAVDTELFRQCPCPVMVVGPGAAREHPRIVGAVHAGTDDAVERALNVKIVELTLLIAELEHGLPTLLQAWEPFAEEMIRAHSSDDAFTTYVENVRQRSEADLARLAAPFGERLLRHQITSRRGRPEDVIREFVVTHAADLVVMGTVARTGISGLLFGNTAERVLRKLPCSVLAVKPDGFVSPVRLDEPV